MNKLEQARKRLSDCFDWTNTAALLGTKEHQKALDAEWEAMKALARAEHAEKSFPIDCRFSVSMRRA